MRVKGESQSSNRVCPWIWSERVSQPRTKAGIDSASLMSSLWRNGGTEKGCPFSDCAGKSAGLLGTSVVHRPELPQLEGTWQGISSRVPPPPVLCWYMVDPFSSLPRLLFLPRAATHTPTFLVSSSTIVFYIFHSTSSSYVAQVGLELLMSLPQPLLCWNYRHVPPHLLFVPSSYLKRNQQKPPILRHLKPL